MQVCMVQRGEQRGVQSGVVCEAGTQSTCAKESSNIVSLDVTILMC